MQQYYKIAGLTVKMDTFGRTQTLALPYGTSACEDVDITIEADYQLLKVDYPDAEDDMCEYIVTGREFYKKLFDFDGMMIHSSSIVVDGKAYLFSGDSGVGKTTHVGLWRQVLGDEKVRILNDDKPAVRLEDGIWYAYGTPWSGKTGMNSNLRVPLGGICFLEQGKVNRIERYSKEDIVFQFMKQTMHPMDFDIRRKLLILIDSLLRTVPIWRLECDMNREAAILSYQTMTGISK